MAYFSQSSAIKFCSETNRVFPTLLMLSFSFPGLYSVALALAFIEDNYAIWQQQKGSICINYPKSPVSEDNNV